MHHPIIEERQRCWWGAGGKGEQSGIVCFDLSHQHTENILRLGCFVVLLIV